MLKPTSIQPSPPNQYSHFPCIGNKHLTSDKETNLNKRHPLPPSDKEKTVYQQTNILTSLVLETSTSHLTKKQISINGALHHHLIKKRLHTFPFTYSAKQQSYHMQESLHIFSLTHRADQLSYL